MGIVVKYKFDQNIYADFIPEFNSTFTDYTITDEIGTDGFTVRTIESDDLPTLIRFGSTDTSGNGDYSKQHSLLEVNELNTDNVVDMSLMFYPCKNLAHINANFNTSKVTNMRYMFSACNSLTSLDASHFDASKVTNMQSMFQNCNSLTSLDLSNFNTSQVTNMYSMFTNCSSLTSLNVSNFNTENVTSMEYMFRICSSLTSLDVSNFDTSQVTNMRYMFQNCSSLTSLDISNFDTSKVTNMQQMFAICSSLTSLDISNFDTRNVTTTNSMFTDTKNLVDIGMIYCNSDTTSKISDLITTDTTIWYSDAKLEDLTKKENITYKEYKMNILESDEEINLRRIGDVYDELNLETGELTQRIGEVVFDGSNDEYWNLLTPDSEGEGVGFVYCMINIKAKNGYGISNNLNHVTISTTNTNVGFSIINPNTPSEVIRLRFNTTDITVQNTINTLQQNPLIICYELATPIIKTINLKGKPLINWQGDTYLHLENNTLYPQLDCEIESINYYEIPKLKANTLYTLRYVGEPTQCIFGGLTYKTENNMILTSGSSDNLLYFDKEVRKVILIEGDVRDRNFDYFEGIESLGAVEIVTHKTNMPIFAKGGRK